MSLSLQTVVLAVLVALAAQIAAFLLNNLEPVREFPGKNRLFLRMTLCLTLLPVLIATLLDEKVIDQIKVGCWFAAGAIAITLVSDGKQLVSAVRIAKAKRRDPAANAMATAVGYAPELRVQLLGEINRQVEQRLKSAYGEQTLVNLEMHSAPDDVEGETRSSNVFLVPKAKQSVKNFKDGRMRLVQSEETILKTFDDKAILGQLLILGAPGSGKTTALLNLAQDLLRRSEDTGVEIPYIFELSAWPKTEPDIASWLMDQLAFEHNIKETVSREWILNGQLLPLLDGLDELATERRQACIEKINEFVTGQLGRRVVVCCRTKVYEASGKKLDGLNGALRIQPLAMGQVQDYFERVNPEIWAALQDETGLGELLKLPESGEEPALLQIPLFLQILAIAYQPDKTISSKSELLDAYIARRLSSRVRKEDRRLAKNKELKRVWAYEIEDKEPSTELTNRYLSWLARTLNEHDAPNVFLIELMQPNWIGSSVDRYKYRLIGGCLSGLVVGLAIGFLYGFVYGSRGIVVGVLFGLLLLTLFGFMDIEPSGVFLFPMNKKVRRQAILLLKAQVRGSCVGYVFGLLLAVSLGLLLALLSDSISWIAGLFIGSMLWIYLIVRITNIPSVLARLLRSDIQSKDIPNQGIFASLANVSVTVLSACLIGTVIFRLASSSGEDIAAWKIALAAFDMFILYFGVTAGGGLPIFQHSLLRFLLHRQGHIPHNYAKFLKYTTERRLTQQIGGSFRFIHRELLDHFAAMDSMDASQAPE